MKVRFSIICLFSMMLFFAQTAFCIPMQYTFEGMVNTVFNYGDPLPLAAGDSIQYVFIIDVEAYTAQFVSGPLAGNYGNTHIEQAGLNSSQNGFVFHNAGNHLYVDVGVQGGSQRPVADWAIGHWSMVADWNADYAGSGFEGTIQLVAITPHEFTVPIPEPATMLILGIGLAGLAGAGVRRKKI